MISILGVDDCGGRNVLSLQKVAKWWVKMWKKVAGQLIVRCLLPVVYDCVF